MLIPGFGGNSVGNIFAANRAQAARRFMQPLTTPNGAAAAVGGARGPQLSAAKMLAGLTGRADSFAGVIAAVPGASVSVVEEQTEGASAVTSTSARSATDAPGAAESAAKSTRDAATKSEVAAARRQVEARTERRAEAAAKRAAVVAQEAARTGSNGAPAAPSRGVVVVVQPEEPRSDAEDTGQSEGGAEDAGGGVDDASNIQPDDQGAGGAIDEAGEPSIDDGLSGLPDIDGAGGEVDPSEPEAAPEEPAAESDGAVETGEQEAPAEQPAGLEPEGPGMGDAEIPPADGIGVGMDESAHDGGGSFGPSETDPEQTESVEESEAIDWSEQPVEDPGESAGDVEGESTEPLEEPSSGGAAETEPMEAEDSGEGTNPSDGPDEGSPNADPPHIDIEA